MDVDPVIFLRTPRPDKSFEDTQNKAAAVGLPPSATAPDSPELIPEEGAFRLA
jgi:hypothetical protein